jgi:Protein of unknown function (DUF3626)
MDDLGRAISLSAASQAALLAALARATQAREEAETSVERSLRGLDVACAELSEEIVGQSTITLNFHPDRLTEGGRSVAEALKAEGVYRNQFETRISNGGLTAYPGGDRDESERALFDGAYHMKNVQLHERPKYGGLNVMNYRNGACPRFGSCHLELRASIRARSTVLYGDSAESHAPIARTDAPEPVLAPLLEDLAAGRGALGRTGLTLGEFVQGAMQGDIQAQTGVFSPTISRALDGYIEAQVHGPVSLATDVDAVVIDRSFSCLVAAAGTGPPPLPVTPGSKEQSDRQPGRSHSRWSCSERAASRTCVRTAGPRDYVDEPDRCLIRVFTVLKGRSAGYRRTDRRETSSHERQPRSRAARGGSRYWRLAPFRRQCIYPEHHTFD